MGTKQVMHVILIEKKRCWKLKVFIFCDISVNINKCAIIFMGGHYVYT